MCDTAADKVVAGGGLRARMRALADASAHEAQAAGAAATPVGTPGNPSDKILTVANLITLCRLALTITFLVIFVSHRHRGIAVGCYAVAAVTDFLDGQIARRTQTVSWLGKLMDPLMDRVLLFTGVLGLVIAGELPLWVAVFVCARDALLGVGMVLLRRYRRRPIDVSYVGKLATALLMFGFSDLLLGAPVVAGLAITKVAWLPGLNATSAPLGIFLAYVGVVCSAVAMLRYVHEGLAVRRGALRGGEGHA